MSRVLTALPVLRYSLCNCLFWKSEPSEYKTTGRLLYSRSLNLSCSHGKKSMEKNMISSGQEVLLPSLAKKKQEVAQQKAFYLNFLFVYFRKFYFCFHYLKLKVPYRQWAYRQWAISSILYIQWILDSTRIC